MGFERTVLEGDARIARLATMEQWEGAPIGAVLAQDTDFIVYNCNYIPFQQLRVQLVPNADGSYPEATASIMNRHAFARKLLELSLKLIRDVLQRAGMREASLNSISQRMFELCSVERFSAMLPDFSMLSGNDYYTTEACSRDVFLSCKALCSKIIGALGPEVDLKLLPKCKISMYGTDSRVATAARYPDFIGIGAVLALCVVCGLDLPHPVGGLDIGAADVQSIIFAKQKDINPVVSRYHLARSMYSMESDFALNATPPSLETAGYGALYKDMRISRSDESSPLCQMLFVFLKSKLETVNYF